MNWAPEQYELWKSKQAGVVGIRPDDPQCAQGRSLVRPVSRKDSRRAEPAERIRIRFTIYAVRPADWDGYDIKELQDMLVHAAILPSDQWSVLQGEVVSEKAYSKEEQRTEIEIWFRAEDQ